MAYIFQQVADRGRVDGITANDTSDARDWYRSAAQKVTSVNTTRLMNDKKNVKSNIDINDISVVVTATWEELVTVVELPTA